MLPPFAMFDIPDNVLSNAKPLTDVFHCEAGGEERVDNWNVSILQPCVTVFFATASMAHFISMVNIMNRIRPLQIIGTIILSIGVYMLGLIESCRRLTVKRTTNKLIDQMSSASGVSAAKNNSHIAVFVWMLFVQSPCVSPNARRDALNAPKIRDGIAGIFARFPYLAGKVGGFSSIFRMRFAPVHLITKTTSRTASVGLRRTDVEVVKNFNLFAFCATLLGYNSLIHRGFTSFVKFLWLGLSFRSSGVAACFYFTPNYGFSPSFVTQ